MFLYPKKQANEAPATPAPTMQISNFWLSKFINWGFIEFYLKLYLKEF